MEEQKIIERAKESLNFIEQLQEQITACRRLLSRLGEVDSTNMDYLSFKAVEGLELLLWAKLIKSEEYMKSAEEINKEYTRRNRIAQTSDPIRLRSEKQNTAYRKYAQDKFKLLLVFIDKQELMPMGDK